MTHTVLTTCAAAAALTVACASTALAAGDPLGVWLDDSGRGAVEIKSCGNALCGHVVAVKSANDRKGCGKQIIGDAQSASGGVWDGGWIYSPEKRKNYDVELKPLTDGTLRVVGYAGTKLFSRTMIWRRAPSDLVRCDVEAAAPKPVPAAPQAATPVAPAPSATGTATPQVPAAQATAAVQPARAQTAPAAAPAATVEAQPDTRNPSTTPTALPDRAVAPLATAKPAPTDAPPAPRVDVPASAPEQQQAEDTDDADSGERPGRRSKRGGVKIGDLDLSELKIDKIIKRSGDGDCKIDLPFVKVQFNCED